MKADSKPDLATLVWKEVYTLAVRSSRRAHMLVVTAQPSSPLAVTAPCVRLCAAPLECERMAVMLSSLGPDEVEAAYPIGTRKVTRTSRLYDHEEL
eukprot:6195975-Pleurochrysis_carterae.AAC.2